MDSITQLALGAAVGYATLGRRVGRRSLIWGAALGTLPDLDVLVPMGDAVADYTYHRSWSHSLFVHGVVTPLFAALATRLHPSTREIRAGWRWLVFLVFATHALLDSFTVYGTQIFWPLLRRPESWSTVFIIDPAYTLPLLVGIGGAWLWHRARPRRALFLNGAGLALSTLYLAWTGIAKFQVEDVVARQLAREGVQDARVVTTPTPLNSLLWRILVMREDGYDEGFYSVVADDDHIDFTRYPSEPTLLDGLRGNAAVERLDWFTHGIYSVSLIDDAVVITDLRMGAEPYYVFRFIIGRTAAASGAAATPVVPEKIGYTPPLDMLPRIWARIWDRRAQL